ncbi:transcriptional regulator [Saccharibacillus sp. O16]|nr:transcriptional regulator [Saccharibacillus sp. O16]
MASVIPGRQTASIEGPFVVFIIGVRINKWWAVRQWLPVLRAMGPMLQELYSHKELGFLDAAYFMSGRGVSIVQYWRSYDQLEHYARGGEKHLKAWKDFNRKSRAGQTVGIYHETYMVEDGACETIYVNMPATGLGRAGTLKPVGAGRETSRERAGMEHRASAE